MSLLEFQQVGYWYKDKSQPLFQDINISFQKENSIQSSAHQGQENHFPVSGRRTRRAKEGTIFTREKLFPKSA